MWVLGIDAQLLEASGEQIMIVKIGGQLRLRLALWLLMMCVASPLEARISPEERQTAIRWRLQRYSPEELQELLARGYMDALKSPSQISGGRTRNGRPRRRTDPSAANRGDKPR